MAVPAHATFKDDSDLQALRGLTMESFLPLSRMKELARSGSQSYLEAKPFPHITIDNFFEPALLDRVLEEFPSPSQPGWHRFDNEHEVKLASVTEAQFGPLTRLLLYHLNSMTFLDFLSGLTGIGNLISDPSFEGGGLHQIVPGGKLDVHADFNKHGRFGLDRRLNLLLYLNKDWREEYGGHLELWNRDRTRCEVRVAPLFNRVMIFGTTDFTYHGHPHPLRCPPGTTRKSLALYYFSNGRPAEEIGATHSTIFAAGSQADARPRLLTRLRPIARDLLPPILVRQLRTWRSSRRQE